MKKDLLIILLLLSFIIFGCNTTLKTGYHEIESIRGQTVNFKNNPNDYHVDGADTLKVGQKIYIQRTYDRKKVTVW